MRKIFLTLTLLALAVCAQAQTAMPFLQEELSPAAAGLAGVASASSSQGMAFSVFGNPAAQPFVDQKLDVTAAYRRVSSINQITAAAGVKFGKFGLSAGFHTQLYPALSGASEGGGTMAAFAPTATLFGLGLSLGIGDHVGVGANVRYAIQKLDKSTTLGALNFDVMALFHLGGLNVTAGVVALGPAVKSVSNATYPLPASARLAVAYLQPLGALSLEGMGSFDYYFSGNVGAGVAAQLGWNDMVFGRVGFRYGSKKANFNAAPVPTHLSLGLGGKFLGIRVDVAYQLLFESQGGILSAGLSYAF